MALSILVIAVMLIFSSSTSPLFPNNYGCDSAYYRFFGASLLNGKDLYTDIWDNKGPVFYFIQALGALHGTRNENISLIFPMQIFSMLLSLHFLNRTDLLIPSGKHRSLRFFFLSVSAILIFNSAMEGGNLTEEWSFSMICCSLYYFARFAINSSNTHQKQHPKHFAFIHGICLGSIAFIRLNNAVSICAGALVIGIYLIIQKQWRNFFENLIFGLLGIFVITLPVFAYFLLKQSLGNMLYTIFIYNLKISGQRTHGILSTSIILKRFMPIIASLLLVLISIIREKKLHLIDYIVFAIILLNAALLISNNICWHYFAIYIPVLLLIFILYTKSLHIPECIIIILLSLYYIQDNVNTAKTNFSEQTGPLFSSVNLYLPKAERNSVIAINVHPEIYLNTGIFPCSRFAAFQDILFSIDPEFEKVFLSDLQRENPKWIIIYCDHDNAIPYIKEQIDSRYEYKFSESSYCFYRQPESE